MSIALENKPNLSVTYFEGNLTSNHPIGIFTPSINLKINLNESVKSRLKSGEEITNNKAIEILKSIKWQSNLKSILTKPIVVIPTCLTLIAGTGLLFFSISIPVLLLSFVIKTIAGLILGCAVIYPAVKVVGDFVVGRSELRTISKAYAEESKYAARLLQMLEADRNLTIKPNDKSEFGSFVFV